MKESFKSIGEFCFTGHVVVIGFESDTREKISDDFEDTTDGVLFGRGWRVI